MLFNRLFCRKSSDSSANSSSSKGVKLNKKNHQPRRMTLEPLESRDLLTVTTGAIDDAEYTQIRAQYPEFELPELQADLNVMTITPDDGALSLADLKSAIANAGTTTLPDLILVRTSASANSVTYDNSADELIFGFDFSQYGSISIIGWGEEKFTIDANEQCSAMSFYGVENAVNLGGLIIQNGIGYQGGGINICGDNQTLIVTDCIISNNYATESGGGIYNNDSSTLIISNSKVLSNSADCFAGGVYNMGSLTVNDSEFSGNSSEYSGGGILIGANYFGEGEMSFGTLTVTNSSFINNSSSIGGGICNWGNSTINNCVITDNNIHNDESSYEYSYDNGGGGIFTEYGSLTVVDSIVSNNNGLYFGGGIFAKSGTLSISNTPISGNTATFGGGVFNSGMLTITDCEIFNNSAAESGGGILNGRDFSNLEVSIGSLSIFNSSIFNNISSSGGGIYNSGNTTITNCELSQNAVIFPESAGGDDSYINYGSLGGGGVYSYSGYLTITDSTITNNNGLYFGGGVYITSGILTLADSQICENSASSGGGIVNGSIDGISDPGTMSINRCAISNNSSEYSGGGVCNFGAAIISDTNIAENTVLGNEEVIESYGGGIYNSYNSTLTLSNSSVVGNIVTANANVHTIDGGGIYNVSATLTINNSIISRNSLSGNEYVYDSKGGGIYNYYGALTVTDSEISCNTNSSEYGADGGGVYSYGSSASVTIIGSSISGNSADDDGGGIANVQHSALTIFSSEIVDNIANNGGGGVIYDSGIATIANSLISGNIAKGTSTLVGGGGIWNCGSSAALTVTNCTIAGNTSYNYGGGIYNYYSKLSIYNSIVVDNTVASQGNDLYNYYGTISGHKNLSSYTAWEESDNIDYDPNLPLFNNEIESDYQLVSYSQAIDMGKNQYAFDAGMNDTCTDLSGYPRFNGAHIDLGAYEFSIVNISQRGVYANDVLISWEQYANAASVRLTWITGTTRTVLGTFDPVGEYTWDTTAYPNGYGLLKVEYLDENEKALFTSSTTSMILNSNDAIVVHRGEITESETWSADRVHLVVGQVVVKCDNLTIENSAVVKCTKNSYLYVDNNATLTVQDNVVFTRMEDDSVAGDTNLDGDLTAPQFGNAYIRGTGMFNVAGSVEMKFTTSTTSGIINVNEVWNSGQVYHITDDVVVANGATLTILPGAIVKFDSGKSLLVQFGGTLYAQGTSAEPIIFTSVKDDQYGGDTNEDDGAYSPAPGDWKAIRISGGMAILSNTKILYGGSDSDNYSDGAIYVASGSMELSNSVVAYSKYVGTHSGNGAKLNVYNSVIEDCLFGTHNGNYTNCTFNDLTNLMNTSFYYYGGSYVNCIIANVTSSYFGGSVSNSYSFSNCVFYNPKDSGPQSFSYVGSNGNVWANPLFRNASKGDYYLMAGSPCIDAGTSVGAPDTDITGAPRVGDIYTIPTGIPNDNGEYFDIGAYEFTDNADSSIDLEPINVQAPDSVTSGENVTIQWTIRNNGSAAALGTWTDSIYLVNENSGQTVLVKEYVHPGSIAAGDLQTFYADVDIPAVVEGEWKVQIHVNPNREIFEGQANDNNIALSANAVIVSVPEILLPCNLIATHIGETYKLHLNAGEVYYIKAEIPDYEPSDNAKAGIVLRAREGFVPTETSYDWISESVEYNQIVYTRYESVSSTIASSILYIPAGETDRDIYLNVSSNYSNSGKTCCLQRLSNELGLESVINSVRVIDQRSLDESDFTDSLTCSTPFDYGKQTTIEVFGVGFNEGMTASLSPGSRTSSIPASTLNETYPLDTIPASSVQILSATRALLTFDMPDWEYNDGSDYFNLVVSSSDSTITLPDLIGVSSSSSTNYATKANLSAKLNLPETIRVGRIYEGSITYSSDTPGLIAPIFIIEGNNNVQLSLTDDFSNANNTLQVFGIGSEQNAGILTSGTYTIKFYFKASAAIKIDLFSLTYNDTDACADTTYFTTWKEYHETLANAITRLNRRGKSCIDVQDAYQMAVMEKEGSNVNAVSGHLRDEQTGSALSNVSLIAKWMDNENNWQSKIVKTDNFGFYSIEYLPNNVTIYLDAIDGLALSKTGVEVGVGDVNDFNLTLRSFNDSKTRVANISGDLVAYLEYANGSLKNNQAAEMSLVVKNTGDKALGSAMIYVQMTDAAGNQKAILTLDSSLKDQSFAASVMPDGFSNNLQVMASGETEGTIQPGETVTIPVYWGGTLRPWNTTSQQISISFLTTEENGEKYTYTPNGNLAQFIDAAGNKTEFVYDEFGNLTTIMRADESFSFYTYNADNLVNTYKTRAGDLFVYVYNDNGFLSSVAFSNEINQIAYEYDVAGNIVKITDSNGDAIEMTYNTGNQPTKVAYSNGRYLEYSYDAEGRKTSISDGGTYHITYTYNELGQLAKVIDAANNNAVLTSYEYDEEGNLVKETNGNGTYTLYAYNSLEDLTLKETRNAEGTILSSFDYTYDASGLISTMTTVNGMWTYGYDAAGQVTSVIFEGFDDADNYSATYVYDNTGNRVSAVINGVEHSYTYNAMNQLLSDDQFTYTYNANGSLQTKTNITTSEVWTYFWNIKEELIAVVSSTGESWEYAYDANGNRTSVTYTDIEDNVLTTEYLYDPTGLGWIVAEIVNGEVIETYAYGHSLTSKTDADGNVVYFSSDLIGSVSILTDANGTILNKYAYDTFGNILTSTETIDNQFQFVGSDGVICDLGPQSLYYMRARYYDASTGRFISEDPLGLSAGDSNLYRYCRNNVIQNVDPAGLAFVKRGLGASELTSRISSSAYYAFFPRILPINKIIDALNIEPLHEHYLGDNGYNVGYFPDGIHGENRSYTTTSDHKHYDDNLIRQAVENLRKSGKWDADDYDLKSHNCQDFAEALRKEYKKLESRRSPIPDDPNENHNGGGSRIPPQSSDPNEIIGPIGGDFVTHDEGTEDEPFMVIDGANWITNNLNQENEYKIYFENKSSATAAAQEIYVSTALPAEMDWDSFQVDAISIGNEIYTLTDDWLISDNTWLVNQKSTGDQIKIRYSIDSQTGEVLWYLRSYVASTADNFPVSAYDGFLPPNDDAHSGEGYIAYRVKYDSDLTTGDVVSTSATIVFDTNEPIETNTWLNTIDVDIPVVQMDNAELAGDAIALAWSGSDVGSGIEHYQIYVSADGGAYTLWQSFESDVTSAVFDTQTPGEYSFYILAVDGAGNIGGDPEQATPSILIKSDMEMRVVTTSAVHASTDVISDNLETITDWDAFYMEFWTTNLKESQAGKTSTAKILYDSNVFQLDANQAIAAPTGITAEISDPILESNGMTSVIVTFTVGEDGYTAPSANTYWGAVHFTPNTQDGAGIQNPLESESLDVEMGGAASGTTVKAMPYDLNRDGKVNVDDFILFATVYGTNTDSVSDNDGMYTEKLLSDYDGDGAVNAADFISFATNYGLVKGDGRNVTLPQQNPQGIGAAIPNNTIISELNAVEQPNTYAQPEPVVTEPIQGSSELVVAAQSASPVYEIAVESELKSAVQVLRQAHSSALLDLYDNQNDFVTQEPLSAKAVDESIVIDDNSFDFLFDDLDSDADDSSDVDLSAVLDELELELI